eukprot:gene8764-9698_t
MRHKSELYRSEFQIAITPLWECQSQLRIETNIILKDQGRELRQSLHLHEKIQYKRMQLLVVNNVAMASVLLTRLKMLIKQCQKLRRAIEDLAKQGKLHEMPTLKGARNCRALKVSEEKDPNSFFFPFFTKH